MGDAGVKLRAATNAFGLSGGIFLLPEWRFFSMGFAVLTIWLAFKFQAVPPSISVSETIQPFTSGRVSSAKEIAIDPRVVGSFDERFAGAFDWPRSRQTAETEEHPNVRGLIQSRR